MSNQNIDIENLSPEQRLQLIEQLWDSLDEKVDSIAMSAAQKKELDARLDRIDAGDDSGIPWDDVMSQVQAQLG